jgi:hypothetical protein
LVKVSNRHADERGRQMAVRPPIETVYPVDNHTEDPDRRSYWTHVYLSAERAMAGCRHWCAKRNEPHPLRFRNPNTGVIIATAGEGDEEREIYTVVPLQVYPDDKPAY